MTSFQQPFHEWLAEVLPRSPVPGVIAYNFNISEKHDWVVEVIGAATYDESNEEWACPPEAWTSSPARFAISRSDGGAEWQTALKHIVEAVSRFAHESALPGAAVLRESKAVCVGFVDGDLIRVWPDRHAVQVAGAVA